MGEIDLQRAFFGGGAATENLQNEAGPVDDLGVPFLFEVALLHRRQGMVDDDEASIELNENVADFLDLAAAEQRAWLGLRHRNDGAMHDFQIDRHRQTGRLFKATFVGTRRCRREDVCGLPSGLLQDRNDDNRAHVVAELLELRNDRRRL
ncbi:hypothetical protein D9M68_860730 [compost metagenome]